MTENAPGGGAMDDRRSALDAAFDEVLTAERAAEEAVVDCRAEAQKRLDEAEGAALRVAARAEARRRQWREQRALMLADRIAELQSEADEAAGPVALDAEARARLASAVERLVDELCGGDAEGP